MDYFQLGFRLASAKTAAMSSAATWKIAENDDVQDGMGGATCDKMDDTMDDTTDDTMEDTMPHLREDERHDLRPVANDLEQLHVEACMQNKHTHRHTHVNTSQIRV